MPTCRVSAVWAVFCLLSYASRLAADEATLFRVFLTDGTSLVSYGEVARVADRVVFSMATSDSQAAPQLQLVNIPADRVDWSKTTRYAESARATQYLQNQASYDYAFLSNEVAEALNQISATDDPAKRLAIVEKARKTLAEWPRQHYNYKQDEVRQMLAVLDEAIADLRARTGAPFNLSFVTTAAPPLMLEPLLPPPTAREMIEQTLLAAHLSDSPAERMALLTVAVGAMERDAEVLPTDWRATTLTAARTEIAAEMETDHAYDSMARRLLRLARQRARMADVRGLQRLLEQAHARDEVLGRKRRDVVGALIDSVQAELDAARRLRLEQDRWRLRVPDFRKYNAAISEPLTELSGLKPLLEDIKALAGSPPDALASILRVAAATVKTLSIVTPPDELRASHALLVSAAQLADSAARTRREAALSGNMARAWDASSAAAGALMLTDRARSDIKALLRLPQLTP